MDANVIDKLSKEERDTYLEFQHRVKETLHGKAKAKDANIAKTKDQVTLEPTIFNQTDDHIIDSKLELSPSELYDKHIKATIPSKNDKENEDQTSIERIKRKYLTKDSQDSKQFHFHQESNISKISNPTQDSILLELQANTNNHSKKSSINLRKKPTTTEKCNKPVTTRKPTALEANKHSYRQNSRTKQNIKNKSIVKVASSTACKDMYKPNKKSMSDLFSFIKLHAQQCPDFKALLDNNGFCL